MPDPASQYRILREAIPAPVRVIAVSKKQSIAAIEQVYAAGCRDFGENYLQEALLKIRQLQPLQIHWHFLGSIQGNKVKEIAQYFDEIHSIDRVEIVEKLNAVCVRLQKVMPIFIQVNLNREPQKSGVLPEDLPAVIRAVQICPQLALQGLMLIPAIGQLGAFAELSALRDRLTLQEGIALPRLSMGMSADYSVALAEAATDLRLGEIIFGQRHA